ncbi:hypothetical protein LA080_006706 [Diaporthe eres]|nr:hypothetical protein LA080_006706 [Diaporthe eres]
MDNLLASLSQRHDPQSTRGLSVRCIRYPNTATNPLRGPAAYVRADHKKCVIYDILPKKIMRQRRATKRSDCPAKTLRLFEQYQAANNAKWPRGRAFHRTRFRQRNAQTKEHGSIDILQPRLAQSPPQKGVPSKEASSAVLYHERPSPPLNKDSSVPLHQFLPACTASRQVPSNS